MRLLPLTLRLVPAKVRVNWIALPAGALWCFTSKSAGPLKWADSRLPLATKSPKTHNWAVSFSAFSLVQFSIFVRYLSPGWTLRANLAMYLILSNLLKNDLRRSVDMDERINSLGGAGRAENPPIAWLLTDKCPKKWKPFNDKRLIHRLDGSTALIMRSAGRPLRLSEQNKQVSCHNLLLCNAFDFSNASISQKSL